jgi:hypothetical protein
VRVAQPLFDAYAYSELIDVLDPFEQAKGG